MLGTNVLLRVMQESHAHSAAAKGAIEVALGDGDHLCIASQTVAEFLAVATRPQSENGLGMPHDEAVRRIDELTAGMKIFFDSAPSLEELKRLVVRLKVTGKKIHDARIASLMIVNNIGELITFNVVDFGRFKGISVRNPLAPA